ncbi:MAG: hypothetical protein ACXWZ1_12505 [Gaiellaceae bacterium]
MAVKTSERHVLPLGDETCLAKLRDEVPRIVVDEDDLVADVDEVGQHSDLLIRRKRRQP